MNTQPSAPALLPAIIPVLGSARPANGGGNAPLSQVRSAADLPDHLYVGKLAAGSFALTEGGWRASYRGIPPSTGLKLDYRRATPDTPAAADLRMYYRGALGAEGVYTGDDVHAMIQVAFPKGIPARWHELVNARLSRMYNLCALPPEDGPEFCAFTPSGIAFQLAVPVPVSRLRDCVSALQALEADGDRAAPLLAHLRLDVSCDRHLEDTCPELPPPDVAHLRAWHATGLRPPQAPTWETSTLGDVALRVDRAHYTLEVQCFLVDLELVVQRLAERVIIGIRKEPRRLVVADSPDYPAILRLLRPDRLASELLVWNDACTRRISFSAPLTGLNVHPPQLRTRAVHAALERVLDHVRACDDFVRAECAGEEQVPVDSAAVPVEEDQDRQAEVELDEESQPLADALIDALGEALALDDHHTLNAFQAWCDEAGFFEGLNRVVCGGRYNIHAELREEVVQSAYESYDGEPTLPRILAQVRETMALIECGDELAWGCERAYSIAGPIRHSDGRLRTLGFTFSRFDEPIDCDGIFADRAAYEAWLSAQGLAVSMADIDRMPVSEVIGPWARG